MTGVYLFLLASFFLMTVLVEIQVAALPADELTETIHTEVQVLPLSLLKSSFPGVALY